VKHVTEFHAYLTEEVVEDYSDGLITRREAMRRLGLLGVSAVVAVPLLAACSPPAPGGTAGPATASPAAPDPASPATPAGPSARPTEAITFDGPENRKLQGAWAGADNARGAVLVIHENRGLTEHISSVAGRLAASGYSALAIDLLSEEGGTAALGGDAEAMAALNKVPDSRFMADLKAGVSELQRRAPGAKVGAVGFCFGGGMVWTLLATGEPRLAAAAPFYGPLPDGANFSGSPNAAVLGVYAEQDERVNATRDAAEAALKAAGLTYEIVTFPGVGHAFFNDTGQRYNAVEAAKAYEQLTGWFGEHLS
jgi:carboxymethylenebutenolidase